MKQNKAQFSTQDSGLRSPKQLKLMKELFDTIDADGGGTIDVEEAIDFYTYLCEKYFHIKKDEETMMAVFQVLRHTIVCASTPNVRAFAI